MFSSTSISVGHTDLDEPPSLGLAEVGVDSKWQDHATGHRLPAQHSNRKSQNNVSNTINCVAAPRVLVQSLSG